MRWKEAGNHASLAGTAAAEDRVLVQAGQGPLGPPYQLWQALLCPSVPHDTADGICPTRSLQGLFLRQVWVGQT